MFVSVVSKYGPRGFSLIELLVIVAIVSVLSSIAVLSYESTVRSAKTAEIPIRLGELSNAELSFFHKPRMNSNGIELKHCYLKVVDDNDPTVEKHPWIPTANSILLSFNPGWTYFRYFAEIHKDDSGVPDGMNCFCETVDEVIPGATGNDQCATVKAIGDLDGDGNESLYRMILSVVDADRPKKSLLRVRDGLE